MVGPLDDEAYNPTGNRHALKANEGTGDPAMGSTMNELLRARRRASRFGGPARPSRHATAVSSAPAPVMQDLAALDSAVDDIDEVAQLFPGADERALVSELTRRMNKAPGERKQTPKGSYAPVAGTWPHDEFGTRPANALTAEQSEAEAAARRNPSSAGAITSVGDDRGRGRWLRDDGEHLRHRNATEATAAKASRKKQPAGYNETDKHLEPVERLIQELTPLSMRPAPVESSSKLRARLTAAEALLSKWQDTLAAEIQARARQFSDEMTAELSDALCAGMSPTDFDEMKSLCRSDRPQPAMLLLGRCVLLSTRPTTSRARLHSSLHIIDSCSTSGPWRISQVRREFPLDRRDR